VGVEQIPRLSAAASADGKWNRGGWNRGAGVIRAGASRLENGSLTTLESKLPVPACPTLST